MTPVTAAYLEHQGSLRRWIQRFVRRPRSDIDDVMQEAFLRAYVVELERPIEKPKSYLFRIAKHVALNRLEHILRWNASTLDELTLETDSVEDEIIAVDSISARMDAISALPPVCRQVYCLSLDDLSHSEISAQLGIAISTVEKHVIKAHSRVGII